ncbi:MAG: MBL fold metallo-hydrolase [Clostridia bacterium]|nr:MBL fold metallo-hydrolase [Clostridia bacterium]
MHIETITVGLLGTNCYALWQEEREDCLLIDPGAEPEKIRRRLGGRRISAILLTHGHFDHIGAADSLAEDGCSLIIHRADAPCLTDPVRNVSWMIGQEMTVSAAARTVEEGDVISAAGVELRVLHTPGHTPGGVCYEAGDALFTGDTLFRMGCGRTDLPGGDEAALQCSLARLAPMLRDHTIYPGH